METITEEKAEWENYTMSIKPNTIEEDKFQVAFNYHIICHKDPLYLCCIQILKIPSIKCLWCLSNLFSLTKSHHRAK